LCPGFGKKPVSTSARLTTSLKQTFKSCILLAQFRFQPAGRYADADNGKEETLLPGWGLFRGKPVSFICVFGRFCLFFITIRYNSNSLHAAMVFLQRKRGVLELRLDRRQGQENMGGLEEKPGRIPSIM
jgi:hypothetical protein